VQLCDELRPTRLIDLVQPKTIIDRLERMAKTGRLQNMLFHGEPGMGKTSAVQILIKRVDAEPYELNGSLDGKIDTFRSEFETWASSCSLSGKRKVCFIDECEYLSRNSQGALRGLIEKYSHIPFLMTANDISKLHAALTSRCMPLCFDPLPKREVLARMCSRYEQRLQELGYKIDPDRLEEIVDHDFPDFREIANRLQFEFPRSEGVSARSPSKGGKSPTKCRLPPSRA
jgi:replication-associated recombination protein RarA